jgi:hypothetical protein
VAGREGQQRNIARALDGFRQLALMIGTGTGDPARCDLAPLGNEIAQGTDIFVINRRFLVGTETANFATAKTPAGSATGTISSKSHDYFSFFIVVG